MLLCEGDQLPSVRNRKVIGSQKTDQSEMLALTGIFLRTGSHFADSRQWHSRVYRIACGEVGIKETVAQRKTSKSVHSSPLFFPYSTFHNKMSWSCSFSAALRFVASLSANFCRWCKSIGSDLVLSLIPLMEAFLDLPRQHSFPSLHSLV